MTLIYIITYYICLLQIQKLSLDKQIELFKGTQELIKVKIGKRAADKFFKEARYMCTCINTVQR